MKGHCASCGLFACNTVIHGQLPSVPLPPNRHQSASVSSGPPAQSVAAKARGIILQLLCPGITAFCRATMLHQEPGTLWLLPGTRFLFHQELVRHTLLDPARHQVLALPRPTCPPGGPWAYFEHRVSSGHRVDLGPGLLVGPGPWAQLFGPNSICPGLN